MMAETYLLQALQAGINSIKQNPSQLASVLTALNDDELAAAEQWFGDPNNVITIAPGFPMETTPLPFIGVTVASEDQAQTGVGLDYYRIVNPDNTVTETRGARFNGVLKGTIYSPDANLIIWISAVCKWGLLAQYDWLGEQGFNNMQLSIGDFEPQPQFLPTFTFARGIFLRGEYDQVFTEIPQILSNGGFTGTYQSLALNAGSTGIDPQSPDAPITAQTFNPLPDPTPTKQGEMSNPQQGGFFSIYKGGNK